MIKSHFTDPRFENHGFVKHIHHCDADCGVVPGTETPLIESYQIEMIEHLSATSGTGGRPRNIALFRKVLGSDPSAGAWQFLEMWEEKLSENGPGDYDDASCAGSVGMLPDGTLHISMAFGKKNASGAMQYQPWEATKPRSDFAAPIERLPDGQPGPPGPPGSGIQLFDAPLTKPAWEGRQLLDGAGEWVDIPAVFGAPSASAYLLRFVAQAATPDVRVRAGTQAAPFFLTVNTQAPNIPIHTQGWAPGPRVWVSVVGGAAMVWLQVLGVG